MLCLEGAAPQAKVNVTSELSSKIFPGAVCPSYIYIYMRIEGSWTMEVDSAVDNQDLSYRTRFRNPDNDDFIHRRSGI
jgi:hypothetical protein